MGAVLVVLQMHMQTQGTSPFVQVSLIVPAEPKRCHFTGIYVPKRCHFAEILMPKRCGNLLPNPLSTPLHEKCLRRFHEYQCVGGMPEAVMNDVSEKGDILTGQRGRIFLSSDHRIAESTNSTKPPESLRSSWFSVKLSVNSKEIGGGGKWKIQVRFIFCGQTTIWIRPGSC